MITYGSDPIGSSCTIWYCAPYYNDRDWYHDWYGSAWMNNVGHVEFYEENYYITGSIAYNIQYVNTSSTSLGTLGNDYNQTNHTEESQQSAHHMFYYKRYYRNCIWYCMPYYHWYSEDNDGYANQQQPGWWYREI